MPDPEALRIPDGAATSPPQGECTDLSALRIDMDFENLAATRKTQGATRIRKPTKQEYFAIRGGEEWRMPVWTLREEASGDIYVVNRDLVEALGKFSAKTLLTVCITRAGNLFVWPVRLPRWDGSIDSYNGSALQIIGEHQGGAWLQVAADRREHVYCVTFPTKSWTPPEWPEIAADDVFRRAFKGNVIESMDHPVVQRIQGVD